MAGVLRTDRVRDISLLRKHVRCGTRLRLDGGEAATGTPDGSGGSTLANLLDQGSRFSGHADRGPLAIGGPLYVRTLAADALRLAEGQSARTRRIRPVRRRQGPQDRPRGNANIRVAGYTEGQDASGLRTALTVSGCRFRLLGVLTRAENGVALEGS